MQRKDWVTHCYQGINRGINRNKERTFCFRTGEKINHRTKERTKTVIVPYGCHWTLHLFKFYLPYTLNYRQPQMFVIHQTWTGRRPGKGKKCLDTFLTELIFREWEELMNLYGEWG